LLLGFPASEAGNPLLIPIAGHELGHTTWQLRNLDQEFGPKINDRIVATLNSRASDYQTYFERKFQDDLIDRGNWSPAYQSALRQSQETFCDFLGIRMFGTSFLHASAYLMSPGGTNRVGTYPSLRVRVANQLKAASILSIDAPEGYASWFLDSATPKASQKEIFLLSLADDATASIRDDLLAKAIKLVDDAGIPLPSTDECARIRKAFERLTPAAHVRELADVAVAAWDMYYEKELWSDLAVKDESKRETLRIETLNELVLKTIEIMEFEQRTKDAT
jgi:hypothetical protein